MWYISPLLKMSYGTVLTLLFCDKSDDITVST